MCSISQVAPRIIYEKIEEKESASDSESDLDDSCDDPDFKPLEDESSDLSGDESDSHPSNVSDSDLPVSENPPSSVANPVASEPVQAQVVLNIDDVTERETNHRGKPIRKCKKCDKKFINLKSCMKHEAKCGQIIFKCNTCKTRFKNWRYLKIHFKTLHKEQMFSCDNPGCETKFHTQAKLKSHMKKHQICKCKTCHKSFKNKKVLKSHNYKKHHSKKHPKKKVWTCIVCQHTVKSERGHRYHMQLHKNMPVEDQIVEGDIVEIDVAPMEGIDGDQGAVLIMVEHNEDLVQEAMEEIIEVDGSSYN